ncbi:MAG TPA: hypothetical protein VFB20_04625 [Burkholderiales bacterium]|nr:hypothetical protein [Burkholderiales bacterium]
MALGDSHGAVFRCRSIMSCTEVCPKGLSPSRAIEQIRPKIVSCST